MNAENPSDNGRGDSHQELALIPSFQEPDGDGVSGDGITMKGVTIPWAEKGIIKHPILIQFSLREHREILFRRHGICEREFEPDLMSDVSLSNSPRAEASTLSREIIRTNHNLTAEI